MGIFLGPFKVTKRGVRVRIGPRIARLHVGAGRAGISSGAGPFTYYQPLRRKRGKRLPRAAQTRRMTMADNRPQPDSGPHTDPLLPPVQYQEYPRTPRKPRKPWSRRRKITVFSVIGLVGLFTLIGALTPPSKPVSHHNPPVIPAAASSSPGTSLAAQPTTQAPQPQPTTQQPVVQQTTQPAPVHTTTSAPPPPPPAPGCSPKTPSGNCYEPGEFCSAAEHDETGTDSEGAAIKCEDTDPGSTWHWVAV